MGKRDQILIINGSPRKSKNCSKIINNIVEKFQINNIEYEVLDIYKMNIDYCTACDYCCKTGKCRIKDDMTPIYKDIRECDTIAIISPVYWWQVSAQAKLFIDRLYSLEREELEGKKLIVVVNGAEKTGDKEYSTLNDAFKMMADYLKMKLEFLGVGTEDEKAWNDEKEMITEFLSNALDS